MARPLHPGAVVWPEGLAVCEPAEWLQPGEDLANEITRSYFCWSRWCDARAEYLRSLGYNRDDAQVESVGDFPARAFGST